MNKIKAIFRALIGYAGSSENPNKMSMRFMGIITAFISQLAPFIALIVSQFDVMLDVNKFAAVIEPLTLSVACVIWITGAVRAVLNTPKVAGYLRR